MDTVNELLIALCDEFGFEGSLGELYRTVYKYTACGPSLGVRLTTGETYYCSDLYEISIDAVRSGEVAIVEVYISSIVEGVDGETGTEVLCPGATPDQFWAAVQRIDEEADAIWKETHGCEKCAAHWGVEFDAEVGAIPVWSDCPGCDGAGIVI